MVLQSYMATNSREIQQLQLLVAAILDFACISHQGVTPTCMWSVLETFDPCQHACKISESFTKCTIFPIEIYSYCAMCKCMWNWYSIINIIHEYWFPVNWYSLHSKLEFYIKYIVCQQFENNLSNFIFIYVTVPNLLRWKLKWKSHFYHRFYHDAAPSKDNI